MQNKRNLSVITKSIIQSSIIDLDYNDYNGLVDLFIHYLSGRESYEEGMKVITVPSFAVASKRTLYSASLELKKLWEQGIVKLQGFDKKQSPYFYLDDAYLYMDYLSRHPSVKGGFPCQNENAFFKKISSEIVVALEEFGVDIDIKELITKGLIRDKGKVSGCFYLSIVYEGNVDASSLNFNCGILRAIFERLSEKFKKPESSIFYIFFTSDKEFPIEFSGTCVSYSIANKKTSFKPIIGKINGFKDEVLNMYSLRTNRPMRGGDEKDYSIFKWNSILREMNGHFRIDYSMLDNIEPNLLKYKGEIAPLDPGMSNRAFINKHKVCNYRGSSRDDLVGILSLQDENIFEHSLRTREIVNQCEYVYLDVLNNNEQRLKNKSVHSKAADERVYAFYDIKSDIPKLILLLKTKINPFDDLHRNGKFILEGCVRHYYMELRAIEVRNEEVFDYVLKNTSITKSKKDKLILVKGDKFTAYLKSEYRDIELEPIKDINEKIDGEITTHISFTSNNFGEGQKINGESIEKIYSKEELENLRKYNLYLGDMCLDNYSKENRKLIKEQFPVFDPDSFKVDNRNIEYHFQDSDVDVGFSLVGDNVELRVKSSSISESINLIVNFKEEERLKITTYMPLIEAMLSLCEMDREYMDNSLKIHNMKSIDEIGDNSDLFIQFLREHSIRYCSRLDSMFVRILGPTVKFKKL